MSSLTEATPAAASADAVPGREWRPPSYWPFVIPALVVVLAIIVFPWLFTIWMSFNEWKVGSPTTFVGFANYLGSRTIRALSRRLDTPWSIPCSRCCCR